MWGDNGVLAELAELFRRGVLASRVVLSPVRSQQSMWTRGIQLMSSTWVSEKHSTKSTGKSFWRNYGIRGEWADDTGLKTGRCKTEQKRFLGGRSQYVKFHKDLNWSLWSEGNFSKMWQCKVSGWCNLIYINVKCFKWETTHPNFKYTGTA